MDKTDRGFNMVTISYETHKCDYCGKEETVNHFDLPLNWIRIEVTQWNVNADYKLIDVEICSKQCAIEYLKNIKDIPYYNKEES